MCHPTYHHLIRFFLLFTLCLSWPAVAQQITFPGKPAPGDYFVDNIELIKVSEREEVNSIGHKLLHEQTVALNVVVIDSLAAFGASNFSIENYAARLFNHWGIGSSDKNYGMLLLISKDDRKARIELGLDWSHEYDSSATQIMNELIIPQFKSGQFSLGILDGVRGMDAMARDLELPRATPPWWFLPAIILGTLALVLLVVSLFRSGRRGMGWAVIVGVAMLLFFILRRMSVSRRGGFGGESLGGFSGGGGATGSW